MASELELSSRTYSVYWLRRVLASQDEVKSEGAACGYSSTFCCSFERWDKLIVVTVLNLVLKQIYERCGVNR